MTSSRQVLLPLIRPIYLPSLIYSVGTGAATPAAVLVGLRLGYTTSTVAMLLMLGAGAGVLGTLVAGRAVDTFGERAALVGATAMGTSAMLTLAVTVWNTDGPMGRIPYVVTVFVMPFVDGTWSVARQALLAGQVPPGQRGRAMNAYGAAQRLGRALGPAVAAVMWGVTGPVGSYALHAATALVACGLIVRTKPPTSPHQTTVGMGAANQLAGPAPSAYPWAAFWVVGIGMVALEALRANRDLLLPLWATTGLAVGERTISTSVAICLALELALFLPAGIAVDAWGSVPVVLTCTATMAAGFGVMAAGTTATWWTGVALLGLGNGIGAGIIKTIGAEIAPTHRRATFLGRWTALSAVGALAGPALVVMAMSARPALVATAGVGVVAAAWLATAGRTHLMSHSMQSVSEGYGARTVQVQNEGR